MFGESNVPRQQDAKPVAHSRAERLLEALHLEENQQVEIHPSEAYERWQKFNRAFAESSDEAERRCAQSAACRMQSTT